jgi:hypothetical protein
MPARDTTDNPFKAEQPLIPGVPASGGKKASPAGLADRLKLLQLPPTWVTVSLAAVLFVGAIVVWWMHAPTKASRAELPPAPAASPTPAPPGGPSLPVGPGQIATIEELSKPWAAKKFDFRNQETGERVPAMVVRLPGGGYWGFSLREPFGPCELILLTDLKTLQEQYDIPAAGHPMVIDPCNRSVFDLTKYGAAASGLVRGEVIAGPGIRPPMAIEIRVKGDKVIAVRSE